VAGLRALTGAIHPVQFGAQRGLRPITEVPQRQIRRRG
jgi:hypothetical protein